MSGKQRVTPIEPIHHTGETSLVNIGNVFAAATACKQFTADSCSGPEHVAAANKPIM